MRKDQAAAINKLLERLKSPIVEGTTYYPDGRVVNHNDVATINRLLDSPDYKLGWTNCQKQFTDSLNWIMSATPRELRKFSR